MLSRFGIPDSFYRVAELRERLPPPREFLTRRGRRFHVFGWRSHFSDRISFRRQGIRWIAPSWDRVIARHVYLNGDWQGSERQAVIGLMARLGRFEAGRRVVVDVGAGIGLPAIPIARETGLGVL